MKALRYIALSILFIFIILQITFSPAKHVKTEYCLDTLITLTAYGRGADKALDAAAERIREIDEKMSAYNSKSEIYKLNNAPSGAAVKVSEETYKLLSRALEFSRITDGIFDITLKPLTDLWGIGTENAKVPTDDKIDEALLKTGWESVELSGDDYSVTLKKEGMALDLGAIAKGYAADEAARVLKEAGIKNACLDLGGNIYVMGKMPLGLFDMIKFGSRTRAFMIGIQAPDEPRGSAEKVVSVENGCVVTSGDYERYFEVGGVRYHHIFDPRTGRPAESKVRSATVLAQDATAADALSTVFFILGDSAEGKWAEYYDEVIFID